jgi:hypothetical protein
MWARYLTTRLSYANVVATLALFISLGGASYAAMVLPPHSVGSRQLRPGAVTPATLSFPLGVAGLTDTKVEDLVKGACNSPLRPGEPAPPCTPSAVGGPTPGREVRLNLRSPGRLIISAVVGFNNEGSVGTTANVTMDVILDRRTIQQREIIIPGKQLLQAPAQALVNVPAGAHTIGLRSQAKYNSNGPGDVLVGPVSLIVNTAPIALGS